ncbi:uncharacterized protein LOC116505453 [Thamnophis elegans]|uniref:uncharacterized protein LOC116505453 n=1 Tax=Thamnophis elegans TaxID=35005 RepID=UPI00137710B7|nr:uncharacterized protein LOC116505453 [Thamnophis elegans]
MATSANKGDPEKVGFFDWLIEKINIGRYKGVLDWTDENHTTFRIGWKHFAKKSLVADDCQIFMAWAIYSNKYFEDIATLSKWKSNFRYALNSTKRFEVLVSNEPDFREYRIIPLKPKTDSTANTSSGTRDFKLSGEVPFQEETKTTSLHASDEDIEKESADSSLTEGMAELKIAAPAIPPPVRPCLWDKRRTAQVGMLEILPERRPRERVQTEDFEQRLSLSPEKELLDKFALGLNEDIYQQCVNRHLPKRVTAWYETAADIELDLIRLQRAKEEREREGEREEKSPRQLKGPLPASGVKEREAPQAHPNRSLVSVMEGGGHRAPECRTKLPATAPPPAKREGKTSKAPDKKKKEAAFAADAISPPRFMQNVEGEAEASTSSSDDSEDDALSRWVSSNKGPMLIPIELRVPPDGVSEQLPALLDSGCSRCMINPAMVEKLGLKLKTLKTPIVFCQIDGSIICIGLPRARNRAMQTNKAPSTGCMGNHAHANSQKSLCSWIWSLVPKRPEVAFDQTPITTSSSQPRQEALSTTRRVRHPSLESSALSESSILEDPDQEEQELSEDEDLPPDAPAFSGLFKPSLFKSILHKAKNTTQVGTKPKTMQGTSDSAPVNPNASMFNVQAPQQELVPVPDLFMDVIQSQWAQPGSQAAPSGRTRNYSVDPTLENILVLPSVDPPIAALTSNLVLLAHLLEGVKEEDKKAEKAFHKTHQAAAWAIKASSSGSFFNRASVIWLCELQAKLPAGDTRLRQDITKIIGASHYSADASLNARELMSQEIHRLLEINAVEQVPPNQEGREFYSILFLVPKNSGGWKAILDLKNLNHHIAYRRFKMQSLQTILVGICQGDLLTSIDLKEAYLHIPFHSACHQDPEPSQKFSQWLQRKSGAGLRATPITTVGEDDLLHLGRSLGMTSLQRVAVASPAPSKSQQEQLIHEDVDSPDREAVSQMAIGGSTEGTPVQGAHENSHHNRHNVTTKAHINRQGGTRSRKLMAEAEALGSQPLLFHMCNKITFNIKVSIYYHNKIVRDEAEVNSCLLTYNQENCHQSHNAQVIQFPNPDMLTDQKRVQKTLSVLEPACLLLYQRNGRIWAKRLGMCQVFHAFSKDPPCKLLPRNVETEIFNYEQFYQELVEFRDGQRRSSPDYTIYLCFGQRFTASKPKESKLILVKLVPNFCKNSHEFVQREGCSSLNSESLSLQISNSLFDMIEQLSTIFMQTETAY